MKVSFFLLKFPLSSETFVLNQITAFVDMGHEVEIVALQKGDTLAGLVCAVQPGLSVMPFIYSFRRGLATQSWL